MPLNSYFLQGSASEQRLVQDLINEQLKIYGQDVSYLPRKIINRDAIFRDVVASNFDASFKIEAYIMNYQGFEGSGDILSKFGVQTTDSITFIVSKERYEDFISPFLSESTGDDLLLLSRPREGDLIYLPLDNTMFEIKYVEGKKPFYQLNNLYVYQLSCEVIDYALDDNIFTSDDEADQSVVGFDVEETILEMINDLAETATGSIETYQQYYVNRELEVPLELNNSYSVFNIDLINDGTGYTEAPVVSISTSPTGNILHNATAVAIMTSKTGQVGKSIDEILISNPGYGYTLPPSVSIISQSGSGAIATAIVNRGALMPPIITSAGSQYSVAPTVGITSIGGAIPPVAIANINSSGIVTSVYYRYSGKDYHINQEDQTITFSDPDASSSSSGNYVFKEIVKGVSTGTTAYVQEWDGQDKILKVSTISGSFSLGEQVVGIGTTLNGSDSSYTIKNIVKLGLTDLNSQNKVIETEADEILDFSESNPFGEF
jgi:hypothetical protein